MRVADTSGWSGARVWEGMALLAHDIVVYQPSIHTRAFLATQAAQEVTELIQTVSPRIVVLELDQVSPTDICTNSREFTF